uniref:NADH dehydrogenase subunit 4L n=1 Tax=Tamerlania zarudnyi TaxID=138578 RepID=A0A894JQJ4_9TREM|nr:NADH dehydrogenase subunit 4L [Tamerlania zarudnyi]QRV61241.1 NADH dehydrogenase subunit 4L [Tamerlania zarudnyi]
MLLVLWLLFMGFSVTLCALVLSVYRLFNWLIVIENLNILLLFSCLLLQVNDIRVFFVSLLVLLTVEVVMCLVVLVRLWDFGGTLGFIGY